MLSISPLLGWFFTLVLLALAARASARLVVARARGTALTGGERNRELGHAAMGFGMAVLLAPGLPRPPTQLSIGFFAALAALAAFDWLRRATGRGRGTAVNCGCAPKESRHLLDPHHAIVGAAMVVMLLHPGMGSGTNDMSIGGPTAMPDMALVPSGTPGVTVLAFLGYVWLAALVLGAGMTRVLAAGEGAVRAGAGPSGGMLVLLSAPATVYACELAMTVLTGLMLLS